ncbi:MAG TPA: hypothetical protein VHA80_05890 [Solirubrobacterales bacterium]|nr:hypothetical protein [Solirubrobacterales bacterium]
MKAANLPLSFAPFCAAELEAKAGTTYRIAIAGGPSDGTTGPFELEIHRVSRPANDNFAAAQTIGPALPIVVDGSNADATVETGEVHPGFYFSPIATVWYRWESPLSGPVDISTCGSGTDDFAAVHTGGTLATLTRVVPSGEDDPDVCPDPEQKGAHDRFDAVAGATYWIQVASPDDGIEGPFHLTITDPNAKPPVITPTLGPAPGSTPTGAGPHKKLKPTLGDAIALCRKRFAGKGKKAKAKRATCITKAERKFALARCHKLAGKARQKRCVKGVRRKFS